MSPSISLDRQDDQCRNDQKVVLVTGGTGYIAKHVVLQLLNAGHSVKATSRSVMREEELRNAISPYLIEHASLARLKLIELDLTSDNGWAQAMQNVDVLMHIASPCPSKGQLDDCDVILPAVEGTMRVVKAARAAGVTRVIVTSSVAAVVNKQLPNSRTAYNEKDWTDLSRPGLSAYVKAKTLAEKALWNWQKMEAPEMKVTTICPAFVLGIPLDTNYGSSIKKVEKLFKGEERTIPHYGYSCVDVHDIALMHLRAMERPELSIGKRFIGSSDCFLWIPEMAQILKDAYPDRNIPTKKSPNWWIWMRSFFDHSLDYVVINLDRRRELSNDFSCHALGINFRDPHISLLETAEFLAKKTA